MSNARIKRGFRVPLRIRNLGLALLALIAAAVIWLATRDPALTTPALPALASVELRQEAEALASYDVRASFQPERRTFTARERVTYTNASGWALDALYFRTYANAFASRETSPAASSELFELCYKKGFSPGGITIVSALVGAEPAKWSYEDGAGTALKVEIPPLAPGESISVTLTYTILIPECAYRFGMSGGIAALHNALPTLAAREGGGWRLEPYYPIGDPFISECANWRVELTLPDGWLAAASGARIADSPLTYEALAVRGFTLTLSDRYVYAQEISGGTTITAYATTMGAARALAREASTAIKAFGGMFGEYPWPSYDIAVADIPFGGMESSALSIISAAVAGDSAARMRAVAHETAHQWFHAAVGNDELREPWLDEALCVYAVAQYIKIEKGDAAYNDYVETEIEPSMRITIPRGVTIGSPVELFANWGEYRTIVYERGASMMLGLSEAMGDGKLNEALALYVKEEKFGVANRAAFMDALKRAGGSDWEGFLVDYLDTYIIGGW
ncbi:MAG: M1 family metallopeptidase [Oscillospiraceae bacterium]|nr:M1 family metallopeptidase [Oscillospiraceae bacterium]